MLVFSVSQKSNAVEWCKKTSSILNDYNISATVFIVGKIAEQYPECVLGFGNKVDIGSQTYSGVNLTGISDYSLKLDEVSEGKAAVDEAGNLVSKAFIAPFGATDADIYSILSRSGILADFSYDNQYNLLLEDQFIKYDAAIYNGCDYTPDYFQTLPVTDVPIIIKFSNTYSVTSLEAFISRLYKSGMGFINASELAGVSLTTK
jgi:peptidoglycan/xylan/chitin deacetylase (PgdA/CDA1 family)